MNTVTPDGQAYSVTFINNSSNYGNVMLFQQDEDMAKNDVMSLAWFAKAAHPGTRAKFRWTIDYSFVWGETGEIIPGVLFNASQVVSAELEGNNQITFSYDDQAYRFINQGPGIPGQLNITEAPSIPLKQAAVGIGMSGAGTFVKQAQPSLKLAFTPKPKYWIAFGNYEEGQILDIQEMTDSAEIDFGVNNYSMVATLNPDNTWSIGTTLAANKKFVEVKKKSLNAVYGA